MCGKNATGWYVIGDLPLSGMFVMLPSGALDHGGLSSKGRGVSRVWRESLGVFFVPRGAGFGLETRNPIWEDIPLV